MGKRIHEQPKECVPPPAYEPTTICDPNENRKLKEILVAQIIENATLKEMLEKSR